MGRKLLVLQWRHSAAWTAWCPASDTDTVEGFQFIRVSYRIRVTLKRGKRVKGRWVSREGAKGEGDR